MAIEIKAPQFPESVADGTIATWHKKVGDSVVRDELLVDIETDKVVLEIVAPRDGVLTEILQDEGAVIESTQLIALFEEGATPAKTSESTESAPNSTGNTEEALSPAVRKLLLEHGIDSSLIQGSGKGGRILKEDVLEYIKPKQTSKVPEVKVDKDTPSSTASALPPGGIALPDEERIERRVPMTRLRARIAERLVSSQNEAAMLTTFNEVNMKPIMTMRKHYKEQFLDTHGVKLGFMSFFVRAVVEALKKFPAVNASLDGNDVVYHNYYDIGVAVSTDRGLVVPVLRDADKTGMAETESRIVEYGKKARDGKLGIEEMMGGTFTISNGGTFGSLFSTPILNQPQTAILGMHKIQDRPMAVEGEVVILPMMYLALSYDHRLIDGKEAVSFLVMIKEFIEDPARLLLEI
ncbi:MAG: 2-oxoglutarate dehydrogenase complex dihydrolipoyllysine-residue succinyltransferase, partial [Gammaproteobacteria bacterium]|nr:2-oxoglutarate dehydrogenase complex dihydrolipoyllysine-residue succinyltransferase [Gammaproteobacteria bacterium]